MFGKIKQFFGFVGIDVVLGIPAQIEEGSRKLSGHVQINATADQHINKVTVSMYMGYEVEEEDGYRFERTNIAEWKDETAFEISAGESREISFTLDLKTYLDFAWQNEIMEKTKANAGSLAHLLNANRTVEDDVNQYFVQAMVDVKGAALDPSDKKEITLIARST